MEPTRRPGIIGKLKAVMGQWVGSRRLKPLPWADSLVDLRAAIRRQLKPTDLEFYYQKNKAKIRVAEADGLDEILEATPSRSESN